MTMKLTIVPKWKEDLLDLLNKEKFVKIGAFFQMLSWIKGMACAKIGEKPLET